MSFTISFLGTSSGGGPTATRNCSSLVCDLRLQDGSIWLVDCAEGTLRQFALQPFDLQPRLQITKVSKIFITHMHADHIMGLVPLLRTLLWPPAVPGAPAHHKPKLAVELYGPAGLRLFIRQNLKMTLTRTNDHYIVHELLTESDPVTPCDETPPSEPENAVLSPNVMHTSELPGQDIVASSVDGLWRDVIHERGSRATIAVHAGPIHHRDPCIGYVFCEITDPWRKLVILGDTYDPSAIIPLCTDDSDDADEPLVSLLIHEATDSHISEKADPSGRLSRRTAADVEAKALARGHSVPGMAGAFAKRINAQQLVLNHIGARFAAPTHARDFRTLKITNDISKKATQAWGVKDRHAIVAYDYLQVHVPIPSGITIYSSNEEEYTGDETQQIVSNADPSWTNRTIGLPPPASASSTAATPASITSSAMVQRRRGPSQHHLTHQNQHQHQHGGRTAADPISTASQTVSSLTATSVTSTSLTVQISSSSSTQQQQQHRPPQVRPPQGQGQGQGHRSGHRSKRGRGGATGGGSDAHNQPRQQGSRYKRSRNQ